MNKRLLRWHIGAGLLGTCLCTASFGADVFRSIAADGSARYATQALDGTYLLYLKEDAPSLTGRHSKTRASVAELSKSSLVEPFIREFSLKHGVDAALVRAVIAVESQYNPHALSAKGAMGVMQLMPATAARYGVKDRTDIAQNIEAGVRYLKDLLVLHNGNVALALASYNAGEGAVARHGQRIPPYKETMLYVPAVLAKVHSTTRNQ